MKAVLLGAGYGTRLAPLTETCPKILVPVVGEPLLGHQIRYLARQGVSELAVNVHYLGQQVRDYLRTTSWPLQVRLFPEEELLGTAGALLPMRSFLTEPFVLLYGDVVTNMDLCDLLRDLRDVATLSYYVSVDTEYKGVLELDDTGRVVAFVEKPATTEAACAINAGVYALDPAILDLIPERGDFGVDVWPTLLRTGRLHGHHTDAYVADIGSIEMLRQVEDDVRRGALEW
jgi:NDP-sugar pyrophosphorylase family protein